MKKMRYYSIRGEAKGNLRYNDEKNRNKSYQFQYKWIVQGQQQWFERQLHKSKYLIERQYLKNKKNTLRRRKQYVNHHILLLKTKKNVPIFPFWWICPGIIPILHSPGLIIPGQLGPISRVVVCSARRLFTITMSFWGIPSVIQTTNSMPKKKVSWQKHYLIKLDTIDKFLYLVVAKYLH